MESLWETLQSNQEMQDAILTRIRRQVEDESRSKMMKLERNILASRTCSTGDS